MGIAGLWDVIGEGEICSIADYASRHFEEHKRPLRIAIDAACWRFTNLTPEQVAKIRDGEPAANPVEKVILWRLLRLLKLNIQPIFVNDGMRRPWKRGRKGGAKLDYELVKLSHSLFDYLKVPYHQAPGEAEAECARLQAEGVVDAVLSDDGDSLMFGCRTLIRQHKANGQRVKDQIRIYRAKDIEDKHDLDAESLVLFALLAGGDYDVEGLPGCGPKTAALLAKREHGLARALCHAFQGDLPAWRERLQQTLRHYGKSVEVPLTFPNFKALGHYRSPVVSGLESLHNLRGLQHGWDRPIDQMQLRVFLRERFNIWTRGYVKHISPIFLVRDLARVAEDQEAINLAYGIEFKRSRVKKADGDDPPSNSEVKVIFSPLPALEIDLSRQPPEEDWTIFGGKGGTPYDPTESIECELLQCLLRHGMPNGGADIVTQSTKPVNRKRKGKDCPGCSPAQDSLPKVSAQSKNVDHTSLSGSYTSPSERASGKRHTPRDDAVLDPAATAKKRKLPQTSEKTPAHVRDFKPADLKLPQAIQASWFTLMDSDAESDGSGSRADILPPSVNAADFQETSGSEWSNSTLRQNVEAGTPVPSESIPRVVPRRLSVRPNQLNPPRGLHARASPTNDRRDGTGLSETREIEVIDLT